MTDLSGLLVEPGETLTAVLRIDLADEPGFAGGLRIEVAAMDEDDAVLFVFDATVTVSANLLPTARTSKAQAQASLGDYPMRKRWWV